MLNTDVTCFGFFIIIVVHCAAFLLLLINEFLFCSVFVHKLMFMHLVNTNVRRAKNIKQKSTSVMTVKSLIVGVQL